MYTTLNMLRIRHPRRLAHYGDTMARMYKKIVKYVPVRTKKTSRKSYKRSKSGKKRW